MPTRVRWVSSRLMIMIASIFITFFILEGFVRVFYPQQLVRLRPDVFIPVDNGLGHKFAANLDIRINTGEREVRLITNEQGYRIGRQPTSDEPEYRILALGDSFLAGLQVEAHQTMTSLLENDLRQQWEIPVEIVNTGVDGYDPNNYRAILQTELARQRYDLVIVFVYLGNDIISSDLAILPPREAVSHRPFSIPTSLTMAEWKDGVFYPINNTLERNSHFYIFFKDKGHVLLARLGLTAYYFPSILKTSMAESPDWETSANVLKDIAYKAQPIPTYFVLIPTVLQVDDSQLSWYLTAFNVDPQTIDLAQPQTILRELLDPLPTYDTTPILQDAQQQGVSDLYGSISSHLGINGHRIIADFLLTILEDIE